MFPPCQAGVPTNLAGHPTSKGGLTRGQVDAASHHDPSHVVHGPYGLVANSVAAAKRDVQLMPGPGFRCRPELACTATGLCSFTAEIASPEMLQLFSIILYLVRLHANLPLI